MRRQGPAKKILRWTLRIAVGLLVLVLVLFTALLFSLRFTKVQELAATRTNAALAGLFKGRIEIQRLGGPTLGGVKGVDARILDPQGRTVIEARGATVDLFWLGVLWQVLVERPDVLSIHIERVKLDHVRVHLVDDGQGSPTLVHAFEPASPSPKNDTGGGTEVHLPAIELRHAWVHGRLGKSPAIDADLDRVEASLASLRDRFELDLALGLRARALPANADPNGRLTAKLRLPSTPKPRQVVKAEFKGVLAATDANARFEMDGERLSAVLDAKAVGPKTFAAIAPALKPSAPIALHVEVAGVLPELRFAARAEGTSGLITLDGSVRAEKATTIQARLRTRELDARGLVPDAPRTVVTLEASARAVIDEHGNTNADYRAESSKLRVSDQELPPLRASGDLRVSQSSKIDGKGTLEIAEPGATAVVDYDLRQVGADDGVVNATARVTVADPARFRSLFSGRGELTLEAAVQPNRSSVSAAVKGTLTRVSASGASVERLALQGTVQGALENPSVGARLEATGVGLEGRRFDRVQVSAVGTQRRLAIAATVDGKKPDRVRLDTELHLEPALELRGTELTLHDGSAFDMTVRAQRFVFGERVVQVDGLTIEGPGRARGAFTWTDRPTRVEVSAEGLEVSRILKAIGIEPGVSVSKADLDVRYAEQRGGGVGSANGVMSGVRVNELEHGSVRLDVAIANRTVSGAVEAIAEGAHVRVMADELRIPQGAPGAGLSDIHGALEATGHVDLKRIEPVLTRLLPLGMVSGTIDFHVRLDRAREGARAPRLSARLDTSRLRASGQRQTVATLNTTELARQSKPWSIDGIDLNAAAELDAATGLARLDATVKDDKGPLVTARVSAKSARTHDFAALIRQDVTRVPMELRVTVPPRALQDLPDMIEPKSLRGVLALDLTLDGTLQDPNVRASANLSCAGNIDAKQRVDLSLDAEYARDQGRILAHASTDRREIGALDARWQGDVARLAERRAADAPSPVRGDLSLELTRFPLDLVPALSNEQIRGRISGNVKLEGFGRDARLIGRLESDTILVGRVGVQKFDFSVDTTGNQLIGKLEIGGNRGIARAEVRAPMAWNARLVPAVERRLEGRLFADNFRIETIAPLVASHVSELQGRLDADVKAEIAGAAPVVEGTITLQKGVAQVPAIGQRFTGIEGKVTIDQGDVRLENFVAQGISGKLTVDGKAKLDGVSLRSAEARLRIAKDDKIPLTVEGATIGDAWGNVDAKVVVAENERETFVRVDVPEFHMELPETTPGALQNLEPDEAIRIGTRLPAGNFVTLPVQPLEDEEPTTTDGEAPSSTTRIEVNLGRSVWLRKGQQVKAQLGGNIVVEQKATTIITGRIELRGGTLDIQGKRFEIDRGTVTFTGGDPSNPTIIAAARWDSPEDYTVTAEYSGTAQQGKLTLRSEPPLSDNEILSLLMFGSPDGSFGSGSGGSNAETALGVAGGTLTQGFNHLMSSLTDLEVSARIDTSTGSARPELVVQVSPRLTARVTQSFGSPTAGQPPDTTFLTVDLRLRRAWSLSTMVGNRGATALDLVWRKRY